MKLLMLGRKIHSVVEDGSDNVMCIWTTGLIHTYAGVTEPALKDIVPGFVVGKDVGGGYGFVFDNLRTAPLTMTKLKVCEIFGLDLDELERLRAEWVI